MRNKVLWRLTPTVAEEHYIRNQALKEGRTLAAMIHRLISESIAARQAAAHQVEQVAKLASLLKGETVDSS